MGTTDSSPQRGTCRLCRCSIVSFDEVRWYHGAERPTAPYPGHFAEPLHPIWTPEDAHEVFERAATVKVTEAAAA